MNVYRIKRVSSFVLFGVIRARMAIMPLCPQSKCQPRTDKYIGYETHFIYMK